MKKHLLFLILCLMGILTSCSQKHTRYITLVFHNVVMTNGGIK